MKKSYYKKVALAILAAAWFPVGNLRADDADSGTIAALKAQIEALSEKVNILERKGEINDENAEAVKKETPVITASDKGFAITSADKNYSLRMRGLLQVDSRTFLDDGGINNNDSFLLRRARLIFQGSLGKYFDFYLVPEFGGGNASTNAATNTSNVSILDAYGVVKFSDAINLQFGKFKSPVGLEQLQSDANSFFSERSLATNLTPNRDIGFQLQGSFLDKTINYAAGIFNGVADNASTQPNVDFDDEKEFAGRVFFHPFKTTSIDELQGLGVGFGGSWGNSGDRSNASGTGLTTGYRTDGQQTFFSYSNVTADGDHYRWSPQGYYYYGPFGFLGEYVVSSTDVRGTTGVLKQTNIENKAWQVAASYVLTGENASYEGVTPRRNFDLKAGTWGAFEIVGRYGELEIDREAFERGFASTTGASASGAQAWAGGLNWYLNKNVRVNLSYHETQFAQVGTNNPSPALVPDQNEKVFITRLQFNF
ncbi:MAG: porin [Verrucomicrobiota bacterium]